MDRGEMKDMKFGEGWCQFGKEKIMYCHECIGRLQCWNAQIGGNDETLRVEADSKVPD
jgi:hypothetical protein